MAKRSTTEEHLATLRRLRAEERSDAGVAALEEILAASKVHGLVLKMAADLVEKWEAKALGSALQKAAAGMAGGEDAIKRDRGCEGKEAVLRVLVTWEADAGAFFRAAAAWKQNEPGPTGPVDKAGECRGLAAIGIAQGARGDPDDLLLLTDLLADADAKTRLRAAQALGMLRGPEMLPLLRLKAHAGDENAEVLGEVLVALLRRDARQVEFVARFLDDDDHAIVESAALALGESHQPAALPPLTRAYERVARTPICTSLLMAIAVLRTEESLAWLLARLRKAGQHEGERILDALRIYRGDGRATAAIEAAAKEGGEELEQAFREVFF